MTASNGRFQRQRLTLAREFRGLTKTELAERIGKTAGAISHFESARSQPDPTTLQALAMTLGVRAEFLCRPFRLQQKLVIEECHFRSLRASSQRDRRKLLAFGTLMCELAAAVDDEVELPSVDLETSPLPPDSDEQDIEELACAVRKRWGLGPGPIREPVRLLEQRGIIVALVSAEDVRGVDAFSSWQGERPFVFLVEDQSPSRVRFDAAHELGHLLLHVDVVAGDRAAEREADRFAAAFLVPRDAFIRHWQGMPPRLGSFFAMKRHWAVSAAMLIRRAYDLGCITQSAYRRLFQQLGASGARKREPYELSLDPPSLLRDAIEVLGTDAEALAGRLGVRIEDAQQLLHR